MFSYSNEYHSAPGIEFSGDSEDLAPILQGLPSVTTDDDNVNYWYFSRLNTLITLTNFYLEITESEQEYLRQKDYYADADTLLINYNNKSMYDITDYDRSYSLPHWIEYIVFDDNTNTVCYYVRYNDYFGLKGIKDQPSSYDIVSYYFSRMAEIREPVNTNHPSEEESFRIEDYCRVTDELVFNYTDTQAVKENYSIALPYLGTNPFIARIKEDFSLDAIQKYELGYYSIHKIKDTDYCLYTIYGKDGFVLRHIYVTSGLLPEEKKAAFVEGAAFEELAEIEPALNLWAQCDAYNDLSPKMAEVLFQDGTAAQLTMSVVSPVLTEVSFYTDEELQSFCKELSEKIG